MQNTFDLIPHIVINPSSLCVYNEVIYNKPKSRSRAIYIDVEKPIEEQRSFINSSRKNDGTLSDHAKRKLSKAIEYIVCTATEKKVQERIYKKRVTFKTAFITLTLPSSQIHKDTEIINKCLNSFLNECRQYHGLKNYVWRAERQKNGNIHFHILIDQFISWYDIRNRWNRIINKLGYVDKFHALHNHKTPNSTDIHSTRKVKNIKAYLTKYMCKQDQTTQIDENGKPINDFQSGRLWSCNQELSQTRGLNLVVDSEIESEVKKIIDSGKYRFYEGCYFKVYYFDYHLIKQSGAEILFKYFSDYLYDKLKFSEQLTFQ
jgi:hypothetical protein